MPKLKQPKSLQKFAFDALVRCTTQYCDALSIKGALTELRESIADMKQHVSGHLPGILLAEFCREFMAEFYAFRQRPPTHNSAALEIIMDVQFVGLTCEGGILHYLNPSDVHRIQGLKVLDWRGFLHYDSVPRGLENYRLQDLTIFIFPNFCSDLDLEIVGPRCLKLEILQIEGSKNVTDRGLLALRPCSEMRIIALSYCSVSNNGVNELLNVHKKLEQFNMGIFYRDLMESFDILSSPVSSIYPSVKRFVLKSGPVSDAHFHSVIALFPNLTHLTIYYSVIGDLCILKDLHSLTSLVFEGWSSDFKMENLKQLLMSVGENISELCLGCNFCVSQSDLNFIFKACKNIERLSLWYESIRTETIENLIIPPFRNLKYLQCIAMLRRNYDRVKLEFDELLELEVLRIQNYDAIIEMTESIMLNNVKFPNLREVWTNYLSENITARINQTAKTNNLDFSLRYCPKS